MAEAYGRWSRYTGSRAFPAARRQSRDREWNPYSLFDEPDSLWWESLHGGAWPGTPARLRLQPHDPTRVTLVLVPPLVLQGFLRVLAICRIKGSGTAARDAGTLDLSREEVALQNKHHQSYGGRCTEYHGCCRVAGAGLRRPIYRRRLSNHQEDPRTPSSITRYPWRSLDSGLL